MTTYTEGNRDAAFILSEANFHRSRDNATLASGQDVQAGTVMQYDGGTRLIPWVGTNVTDGTEDEVVGILINTTDSTAGHKAVSIISRHAEVILSQLTYPAAFEAVMLAQLAAKGIICRS
jgi:hypothetical protein